MNVWLAGLILLVSAGILILAILPRRRRHDGGDAALPMHDVALQVDLPVAAPAPPRVAEAAPAATTADIEAELARTRAVAEHMAAMEADVARMHDQFQQRLDSIEAALRIRLDMLEQGFKADLMAKVEEQRAELERVADHFQWLRTISSGMYEQDEPSELAGMNGHAARP